MFSSILLEPPRVDESQDEPTESETADPALIAGTTTSLGSYGLRWELALKGRVE